MSQEQTQKIKTLLAQLDSKDRTTREQARTTLVKLGSPAVEALGAALNDKHYWIRHEAARALGEIGDPAALPALINALEDEEGEVRWQVGESLSSFHTAGAIAVLQALIKRAGSSWFRTGAHHVLQNIFYRNAGLQESLKPVILALGESQPALTVPVAASKALNELEA